MTNSQSAAHNYAISNSHSWAKASKQTVPLEMVSDAVPQIQPGHGKMFCSVRDGSVCIQCISSFLLLYCLNCDKVLWDGDSKEKGNITVENQVAKNQAALYEWAGFHRNPKSIVQVLTEGLKWAAMYFVKLPACSSLHRSTEIGSKRTYFRNACWSTVLSVHCLSES